MTTPREGSVELIVSDPTTLRETEEYLRTFPAGRVFLAKLDCVESVAAQRDRLRAVVDNLCAFIESARQLAMDDGEEDDRVSGSEMNLALSPWEVIKLLGDEAGYVKAPNEDWDYARQVLRK